MRADTPRRLSSASAWGEIFGGKVTAAAMIHRLVHHAWLLALEGDSYRLKDRDLHRPAHAARRVRPPPAMDLALQQRFDRRVAESARAAGGPRLCSVTSDQDRTCELISD